MKTSGKVLLILCLPAFCLSCNGPAPGQKPAKEDLFRRDRKKLSEELNNMMLADQAIRHFKLYGTDNADRIDSLQNYFDTHNIDFDSLDKAVNFSGLSGRQKDSISKKIAAMDTRNTLRMIEIINAYGYPAPERFDSSLSIDPGFLLEHGDWAYKDTVMKLLDKELKHARIDTATYELIRWNMNGRVGYPKIPGLEILKKNPDGTTDTIQKGS